MIAHTKDTTFLTVHDPKMALDLLHRGFLIMDFSQNNYVFTDTKYFRIALKKYPNYEQYVTYGCCCC